jgi:RND family efflux transporter MFP subunit
VILGKMLRVAIPLLFVAMDATAVAATQDALAPVRAQLTARRATVLSSEIAGKVATLPVKEGESFDEGDEIASIDCAGYRARLLQADAQVNAADRKAEALRILNSRGATRKVDLDLAEIEIAAAKALQKLASIDVSRCSILAPFAGRVAETKVQPSQYVMVGQPIIDIVSARELDVELLAPSAWLPWLRPGASLSVRIDELGRDFPAIVSRIGARIDPVSQAVKVYARLDGSFPELIPGMSGLARFARPAEAAVRR